MPAGRKSTAGAHARCRSVDVARDLHRKAGCAAAQSSGVAPYGGRSHGASPARASVCASIKVTQTIDRILMAALKYGYLQLFGLNPRFSHGPDSSPTIGELSCFLSIYLRPVSVPGNSRSESVRYADSAPGSSKALPKESSTSLRGSSVATAILQLYELCTRSGVSLYFSGGRPRFRNAQQRIASPSLVILDLRGICMARAMITRSWIDSPPPDRAGNAYCPWSCG